MHRVMSFDFETYSETDIASCGSYKYIEDPAFEILLLSYAFDDEPVKTVDFAAGEDWPQEFLDALSDPSITKTAYNAAFERYALERALGLYQDPAQYEDTMVLAAVCGLPLSLSGACEALHMGDDVAKMKEGKALIRYFCSPCKPTKTNGGRTRNLPEHAPGKWDLFKTYNAQDVVAERAVRNRLLRYRPDGIEHKFWAVNTRLNERGVRIDTTLARQAVAIDDEYKARLTEEAIALTGLENPKSVAQIKAWLKDQEGLDVASLNKKVVADVVGRLQTDAAREFMRVRAALAKSSTSKYAAMLRSLCADGTVKGTLLFYGASRTGRFAGRIVQPQNLPQNHIPDLATARSLVRAGDAETVDLLYDNISDTLSQLIRTAIIPEAGHRLIVSDFSAIEARVIAWFAGEQWRLKVFEDGGDIYCQSASQMFKVPVEKHGVNGELRQKGKVAELACGYGGGVNALIAFGADKMGMSDEEMAETVAMWRDASPNICRLWKSLENAAIKAIVRKTSAVSRLGNVRFDYENGILWMNLPSGRRIAYWDAQYAPSKWKKGQKAISYMGLNDKNKWARIETWGGKLVENLVQATARDCLRDKILALDAAGFDIRMHVHDEIVVTEPLDGKTLEQMNEIMNEPLPWAEGLPLRGDGYYCDFYQKD